jgi:hypothetical protein
VRRHLDAQVVSLATRREINDLFDIAESCINLPMFFGRAP